MAIPTGIRRDQIPTERDRLAAEAREILDRNDGTLSTEDQAAYDERIADLDALRERDQRLDALERAAGNPNAGERVDLDVPAHLRRDRDDVPQGPTERHTEASRLLARHGAHLGDELPDLLARVVEADPTGRDAAYVLACADRHYASAFAKALANPTSGHRGWTTEEDAAWQRMEAFRALDTTTGDAMVPTHLDPSIMLSGDGSADPMRSIARVVRLSVGNVWHGVSSDGVTVEWVGENTEAADGTPTLEAPEVPVHRADAFVPVSIEALHDMTSVQSEMRKLLADGKAQSEAQKFISGTGTNEPTGLLTGLTATETVTTATAATFADEDVYSLVEALPPRFRQNARWLAALGVINATYRFETTSGSKEFPEIADDKLLRKPLHEHSEISDATTTTGQHILVVGDFANYVIADRLGSTVELVPHLFGANRRPTGQRGFWFMFRTGGAPVVLNAFRRLEVA